MAGISSTPNTRRPLGGPAARRLPVRLDVYIIALLFGTSPLSGQQDTTRKSPVALGDSLYHAGTCPACHASDGSGIVGVAVGLNSRRWLNGDGSLAFLMRIIEVGVAKPKRTAAPMPPNGGMALTPDQRRALAAYLLTLSHVKTPSR